MKPKIASSKGWPNGYDSITRALVRAIMDGETWALRLDAAEALLAVQRHATSMRDEVLREQAMENSGMQMRGPVDA